MAITYKWNFDPLDVQYSSASLTNVVTVVHWQYSATTEGTSSLGQSGSFVRRNIGAIALDPVASADFTAYDSLTEAQVRGWVTASLGDEEVARIQTHVSTSLAEDLNPSTGPKTNPWQ